MLGRILRRVRDTFAAGAAERRFRQLERETRDLLQEMQSVMEKLARQAATDARRRAREAARVIEPTPIQDALHAHPPTREHRKAELRARMRALRGGQPQAQVTNELADPGG